MPRAIGEAPDDWRMGGALRHHGTGGDAEWPIQLVKTYRFKNFREAVDFVNKIAPEAEAMGHHPDLLVRWGEVAVHLTTHSAGGVTEKDLKLATKMDQTVGHRCGPPKC